MPASVRWAAVNSAMLPLRAAKAKRTVRAARPLSLRRNGFAFTDAADSRNATSHDARA